MSSLPVDIAELLRLTHGTTALVVPSLSPASRSSTIFGPLMLVLIQATTYDHKQDTATVEQPKLLPHCDQDLHAALLVWLNALRKVEAVHLAPTGFKLLEGLNKLISKLGPEFRQMLKQAEFIDKSNGKPPWTHMELLPHLHRHAAEALRKPFNTLVLPM